MRRPTERILRLALLAAALPLAGCQDHLARRETISYQAGDAIAANKAIHIIDPWPAGSARTDIEYSGRRTVGVIERYEAGPAAGPAPLAGPVPMIGPAPLPPPPAPAPVN